MDEEFEEFDEEELTPYQKRGNRLLEEKYSIDPEDAVFTEPEFMGDDNIDFSLPSNEYPSRLNIWDQGAIGWNENRLNEGLAGGAIEHTDIVEKHANDFRKIADEPDMYHAISQSNNPLRFFKYHRDRVVNQTIMPEDPYKRFSSFEKADMLSFLFTRPEFHMTLAQKPIYFWDHPSNFAQKLPHLEVNENMLHKQIVRFYAFQSLVLFGVEEAALRRFKNIVTLQQATGESYKDARRRDIPWFSGTLFAGLEQLSHFVGMLLSDYLFSGIFSPLSPAYHLVSSFTQTLISHPFMVLHTRSLFPYGRRPGGRDLYAGIGPRLVSAWIDSIVRSRSDGMPFLSRSIINSILSGVNFLTDCISRRQQAAEVSKEFEPVSSGDAILERFQHGKKGVMDSIGSGLCLAVLSIGVGAGITVMQLSGLNAALYPARITKERGRRHPSSLYNNSNYNWETTLA